jgi:hypothetical protein
LHQGVQEVEAGDQLRERVGVDHVVPFFVAWRWTIVRPAAGRAKG